MRYQLAETLEKAGDWPGALQERTTILERVEAPSALELRALANCALHTGEHQLAADVCQQALQIDSEDGLAFALLGQAHFELGSVERALEFVRQATQLAPHHPNSLAHSGCLAGKNWRSIQIHGNPAGSYACRTRFTGNPPCPR